jgi:integrase
MRKQVLPFHVKTIRCTDGERLPTLLDECGAPDFDATLWVVISLRGKHLASATIEQALRSLAVLYFVLRTEKINLTERLRAGRLLDPAECEVIAKVVRQKTTDMAIEMVDFKEGSSQKAASRVIMLEKYRGDMSVRDREASVEAETSAIRMGYIRAFLNWRVNREILRSTGDKREKLIALRDLVDAEIKNKVPTGSGRSTLGARMGIDRESQALLRRVVTPTHPQNPWMGEFIRTRNQLIVNAFLALGVRRGELLGARVNDLKPQMQEILILRRPDDSNDPRLDEPNTKTRDRVLPLSAELYRLVKAYLPLRHAVVRGAHDFLFVANTGEPISKSGLNRLFCALNEVPGLPKVEPHILRHSFFENLADDLHRAGKGDAEMLGYLRQQGGWSDTSDTPFRYIKRFVQERAREASLSMQERLLIKASPEDGHE